MKPIKAIHIALALLISLSSIAGRGMEVKFPKFGEWERSASTLPPQQGSCQINYFEGSLEEAKAKAKEEGKLVSVFAYYATSGSKQLKSLTKEGALEKDGICTYYNEHFINIKTLLNISKNRKVYQEYLTDSTQSHAHGPSHIFLYLDGDGNLWDTQTFNDPASYMARTARTHDKFVGNLNGALVDSSESKEFIPDEYKLVAINRRTGKEKELILDKPMIARVGTKRVIDNTGCQIVSEHKVKLGGEEVDVNAIEALTGEATDGAEHARKAGGVTLLAGAGVTVAGGAIFAVGMSQSSGGGLDALGGVLIALFGALIGVAGLFIILVGGVFMNAKRKTFTKRQWEFQLRSKR